MIIAASLLLWMAASTNTVDAVYDEAVSDPATDGYVAYNSHDYALAARYFEDVLDDDPSRGEIAGQLGYAYKALGRNDKAAAAFKAALGTDANLDRLAYRREVQVLENVFDLSAYSIYRKNALGGAPLAAAGPTLIQSQGGMEAAWRLPHIGYRNGKTLHLFGRVLWGYDGNRFSIRDESWQSGVGLRWKPWRDQNIVFTGERLIAIGNDARNDWMLRASYSWDQGYGIDFQKSHWLYSTLYLDAAMIDPTDPDLFLSSEGRLGMTWRLSGNGYGPALSATPHVVGAANIQKDTYDTTSLVELGFGVSFKLYGGDSLSSAHGTTIEMLAQYRIKAAGDSGGSSGAIVSLILLY